MFNWREYTAMVSRKVIRNNPLEIVAFRKSRHFSAHIPANTVYVATGLA